MRLSQQQQEQIRSIASESFGKQAPVWLFGSRLDPFAKGGDVDLLVESDKPTTPQNLRQELLCKIKLAEALDLPVDLIVRSSHDTSPIAQIARGQGVLL
jgi:predicted nucleotidyltransferase